MKVCTPLVGFPVRLCSLQTCRLPFDVLLSVSADMHPTDKPTLTVNVLGTGSGTTTVSVDGAAAQACSTGCTIDMPTTASVVNIATVEATGSFAAIFSGDCGDATTCGSLTMNSDKTVTVTYEGVYPSCRFSRQAVLTSNV
jgi:hypothetical protein